MTPKEKAKELVDKYFLAIVDDSWSDYYTIAKECALIAVDEILKIDAELTYDYDNIEKNEYVIQTFISYWKEVKKEIESL